MAICSRSTYSTVVKTMPRSPISLCVFLMLSVGIAASTSIATVIDPPMRALFSLDGQHLWVLAHNKDHREFLFSTSDGGTRWTASPLPFSIWRVFFADRNEGWGIAAEGTGASAKLFCAHTLDSGRTWERLGPIREHDETPAGIAFDTREHGWVVGGRQDGGFAFVLETSDGGKRWKSLSWETQPASGLYGVSIHDGYGLAWSGGAGGSGIYELRRGVRPKRISSLETMDFALVSEDSMVSASQLAVYRRTGQSSAWEEVLQSSDSTFQEMSFVDSVFGCIAGGEIYCTNDGGRTWVSRTLPTDTAKKKPVYVFQLHLIDMMRGWAVSEDAIFETHDGARTWAKVDFFDAQGRPLERLDKN
jgi:photosystem II stability/assembly factor-like uncharacterized protein